MISQEKAREIAENYYTAILSYCYSYVGCNDDLAQDITQDVFLIFQEKCPELEDIGLYTWLITTAHYKCLEYRRLMDRERRFMSYEQNSATIDYEEFFDLLDSCLLKGDEDLEKYIKLILKTLTAKEMSLYEKMYVEHKSHKQVAEEMGISESAVNSRAHRLREKLKLSIRLMTTVLGQLIIRMFF